MFCGWFCTHRLNRAVRACRKEVATGRFLGYTDGVLQRGGFRAFAACAIIFAMLAVAVAPLWHNHQDGDDHHDCPTCVAVHAPTGSGLPGGVQIVLSRIPIGLALARPYSEPVVRFPPVLWTCGPPVPGV